MITAEDLRSLPLFEKVSESEMHELIGLGDEVGFAPGDELWTQGTPADAWWVLLDGRIDLVRTVGHEETVLGAMDAPGRWAGGFRAWDEHAVYLATGRASAGGRASSFASGCQSSRPGSGRSLRISRCHATGPVMSLNAPDLASSRSASAIRLPRAARSSGVSSSVGSMTVTWTRTGRPGFGAPPLHSSRSPFRMAS